MAKEIERKFLVCNENYKSQSIRADHIVQGYLSTDPDATIRIRILNERAFITVKSRNDGSVRQEWEYEIPLADAREMLALSKSTIIDKTRFIVKADSDQSSELFWEVDEFHGPHEGLTVAEIELPSPDTPFHRPDFISLEVTGNPQYYNSTLAGV